MSLPDVLGRIVAFFWNNGLLTILLILGIVVTVALWRSANARAEGGPRQVIVFVMTLAFFLLGFLVLLGLIAFAVWVGPFLAQYANDRLETGADRVQNMHILESGGNTNDSGDGGGGGGGDGGGRDGGGRVIKPGTYTVNHSSGCATLREKPDANPPELSCIPNGTVVEVVEVVESNCLDGVCQRAKLKEPAGWVHGSTLGN